MTPANIPHRQANIDAAEAPILARVAVTRAEAGRWQWVREAYQGQRERPEGPSPDRYHLPRETLFAGLRGLLYGDVPTKHHLGWRGR